MSTSALAFDASSARTVDENGFLHVTSSHITKATVNPVSYTHLTLPTIGG